MVRAILVFLYDFLLGEIYAEDDFFLKHDLLRNEKKRLRSPSKLLMNSTNDDGNLVLKLQEALKPFILRRKKEEVCLDLPPKVLFPPIPFESY